MSWHMGRLTEAQVAKCMRLQQRHAQLIRTIPARVSLMNKAASTVLMDGHYLGQGLGLSVHRPAGISEVWQVCSLVSVLLYLPHDQILKFCSTH